MHVHAVDSTYVLSSDQHPAVHMTFPPLLSVDQMVIRSHVHWRNFKNTSFLVVHRDLYTVYHNNYYDAHIV